MFITQSLWSIVDDVVLFVINMSPLKHTDKNHMMYTSSSGRTYIDCCWSPTWKRQRNAARKAPPNVFRCTTLYTILLGLHVVSIFSLGLPLTFWLMSGRATSGNPGKLDSIYYVWLPIFWWVHSSEELALEKHHGLFWLHEEVSLPIIPWKILLCLVFLLLGLRSALFFWTPLIQIQPTEG